MLSHIASHISPNPIGNILLVHRVGVRFVTAWSRKVYSVWFDRNLYTKGKFGIFALGILWICWVFEVKIADHLVAVGRRRILEGAPLLISQRTANSNTSIPVSSSLRRIGLRSNGISPNVLLLEEFLVFI